MTSKPSSAGVRGESVKMSLAFITEGTIVMKMVC